MHARTHAHTHARTERAQRCVMVRLQSARAVGHSGSAKSRRHNAIAELTGARWRRRSATPPGLRSERTAQQTGCNTDRFNSDGCDTSALRMQHVKPTMHDAARRNTAACCAAQHTLDFSCSLRAYAAGAARLDAGVVVDSDSAFGAENSQMREYSGAARSHQAIIRHMPRQRAPQMRRVVRVLVRRPRPTDRSVVSSESGHVCTQCM